MLLSFMPRFKPCSYEQKVFIPLSLEEQLVEGTLEYAIHHLIDERVKEEWFADLSTMTTQDGGPILQSSF